MDRRGSGCPTAPAGLDARPRGARRRWPCSTPPAASAPRSSATRRADRGRDPRGRAAPERVQALVLYATMVAHARRRRARLGRRARAVARSAIDMRSSVGHRREPRHRRARRASTTRGMRAWLGAPGAPVARARGGARAMAQTSGARRRAPTCRAQRPDAGPAPHRRPRHRRAPLALIAERVPGARSSSCRARPPAHRRRHRGAAGRDRGVPHRRAPRAASQRALLTVLFTDIVDATGHAARMGDAALARPAGRP